MPELRAQVTGALLGCAVGDAMGAPFEGLWPESIPSRELLLAGYHLYDGFPKGQYTDDTQLTVATVESLAQCRSVNLHDIAVRIASLWRNHTIIGPGGACTHAAEVFLATSDCSAMGAPSGQAGNGTAMRMAAVGLWYVDHPEELVPEVAEISRLTHRDLRSVAGGVAIAEAARLLATSDTVERPEVFCRAIATKCTEFDNELSLWIEDLPSLLARTDGVERIAFAGQKQPEFERPIITPFVVPTVLAAIYCVLKHPSSWEGAVTEAIGLGGDVDTLGAIVGALLGARLGETALPRNLVAEVQDLRHLRLLAEQYYIAITQRN